VLVWCWCGVNVVLVWCQCGVSELCLYLKLAVMLLHALLIWINQG